MNEIIIRPEMPQERRQVEELVRDAFWNVYRPGAMEHFVPIAYAQSPPSSKS